MSSVRWPHGAAAYAVYRTPLPTCHSPTTGNLSTLADRELTPRDTARRGPRPLGTRGGRGFIPRPERGGLGGPVAGPPCRSVRGAREAWGPVAGRVPSALAEGADSFRARSVGGLGGPSRAPHVDRSAERGAWGPVAARVPSALA